MTQNGKGDKPRPMNISREQYAKNWNMIFCNNDNTNNNGKQPKEIKCVYVSKVLSCPTCNTIAFKHHTSNRTIKHLNENDEFVIIKVEVSTHYCDICKKHFRKEIPFAFPNFRYSIRVMQKVREKYADGATLKDIENHFMCKSGMKIPERTIYEWVNGKYANLDLNKAP